MARPGASPDSLKKEELPKSALNWTNIQRSARLFRYLGAERWKFIAGLVFLIASAAVGLIFPLKSGELIGYIGEDQMPAAALKTQL